VTSNHRRIIHDQEREILRFSEGADVSALNIQIQEGDAFITLYGDKYPISHDANGRLQILVKYKSGEHGYIGVYQEIFSRTWQLETKNSPPVYSRSQRALIQRLKLPLNKNYRYSIVSDRYPRAGPSKHIIEVRNLQDDVLTTAPLYMAIEMYGELVPLRVVMTGKHGLRYQIYDIHHPMSPSYLVIWDGRRWCFERWTSPHVSRKLSESISPVMFAKNIDESTLSAPDAQGIKWTVAGRG